MLRPAPSRLSPPSPAPRRARRSLTAAVGLALLAAPLAACSADDGPSGTDDPSPSASASAVATELPDSPVGEAAAWILAVLDDDAAPAADDLAARFAPSFLEQVPADQLVPVLAQLQADAPYTVVGVTPADATTAAEVTIVGTSGQFLAMQVALDDDGLVEGLLFGPGTDPTREPATTWSGLEDRVGEVDARSAVLVAQVGADGTCTPVEGAPSGSDPDAALPLGSIVKLYVLGAVVAAVEDGSLAWDDELELTDDVRSLPSGRLQDEPVGTTLTVREAAELMISISDNTATDLLVDTVGREAVEDAQAAMGHHDPALNTPLLTTRDLFRVGWGDPALRGAWADGDAAERRALLDDLPGGVLDVDPGAVTDPVWQDDLDWFATSADLCAAHAWLHDAAGTDAGEPVREILSANPGIEVDTERWPYLAFKGGSAPGVLAGSWLAEDADGTAWVVTVQLAADDPLAVANPAVLVDLGESAFTVLGADAAGS